MLSSRASFARGLKVGKHATPHLGIGECSRDAGGTSDIPRRARRGKGCVRSGSRLIEVAGQQERANAQERVPVAQRSVVSDVSRTFGYGQKTLHQREVTALLGALGQRDRGRSSARRARHEYIAREAKLGAQREGLFGVMREDLRELLAAISGLRRERCREAFVQWRPIGFGERSVRDLADEQVLEAHRACASRLAVLQDRGPCARARRARPGSRPPRAP